jgi:hypothetical protein
VSVAGKPVPIKTTTVFAKGGPRPRTNIGQWDGSIRETTAGSRGAANAALNSAPSELEEERNADVQFYPEHHFTFQLLQSISLR